MILLKMQTQIETTKFSGRDSYFTLSKTFVSAWESYEVQLKITCSTGSLQAPQLGDSYDPPPVIGT